MGWSDCGTDSDGRPIGYGHEARCDEKGCRARIDRGLAYACGGMHGADEYSCEGYFCEKHLFYADVPGEDRSLSLCKSCADAIPEAAEA